MCKDPQPYEHLWCASAGEEPAARAAQSLEASTSTLEQNADTELSFWKFPKRPQLQHEQQAEPASLEARLRQLRTVLTFLPRLLLWMFQCAGVLVSGIVSRMPFIGDQWSLAQLKKGLEEAPTNPTRYVSVHYACMALECRAVQNCRLCPGWRSTLHSSIEWACTRRCSGCGRSSSVLSMMLWLWNT